MSSEYIGKTCPFCRTEFQEGDDIVVCSACDMPHHKECWIENKGCTTFGCSGTIKNIDGTEYWNNGKEHNYNYLERDAIKIELKNPELTNIQQIITFQLTYQDKFDKYHTLLVNGKQTGTSISFPKFFVNEI